MATIPYRRTNGPGAPLDPRVRFLLDRLATDTSYADRFFADPRANLAGLDLPDEERAALEDLDRAAVVYLADAARIEPELAPEHPSNSAANRHLTLVIALWGCAAFVLAWLVLRT